MIEKEILEDVKNSLFNPQITPVLQTGFSELDMILKHTKKSSLIVLGARPSMGKTAFATSIMLNLLHNGKNCLFFSPMMCQRLLLKRLIIQTAEIDNRFINKPELLQEEQKSKIQNALDLLSKYSLTIDDTSCITTEKIRKRIEEEKSEYVFINYLQLIDASHEKNRNKAISKVMQDLKQIAEDNNCIIFINSQVTRAVECRKDKRPLLSDLKDYCATEEFANVIMFLYRDEYYTCDVDLKEKAEIIVAKNDMGPVDIVPLSFKSQFLKFYNQERIDIF